MAGVCAVRLGSSGLVLGKGSPTTVALLVPSGSLRAAAVPAAPVAALTDNKVVLALTVFALLVLLIRLVLKVSESMSLTRTLERRVEERTTDLELALRDREAQRRALAESEERFRMLAETASDIVFRFRIAPTPGFEYLSPSVERVTGYTVEELYKDPTISWARIVEDLDLVYRSIQDAANESVELRWRRKDDRTIWIELRTAVVRENGEPIAFQGIARDITSRKKAEAERTALAAIVESSAHGIVSVDLDGRFISWNHGAEQLLGYSAQEIIGKPLMWLVPPDRVSEVMDSRRRCTEGESVGPFSTQRIHKDGRLVDVSITLSPLVDESGSVTGTSAIMQDIGDRLRAEQQLRVSEARSRIILEAANTALIGCDPNGRVAEWNRRAEGLLGYSAGEALGRHVDFLFPPEHVATQRNALSEIMRTGKGPGVGRPAPLTAVRKDGRRVRLEAHVWPVEVENTRRVYAFLFDVTERTRAERALRRSEETFRSLLQTAPDAAVIVDSRKRIVLINTAAENMFGYPLDRLLGEPVETLLPDGLPATKAATEQTGRRRDEQTFPVEVRLSFVEAGDEVFTAAYVRDITERKLVEEALRRSEKRFRSLLQSAPDAAIIIDGNGRIVLANTEAERLYGYEPGDLVGRDVAILVPERFRVRHGMGFFEVARNAQVDEGQQLSLGHARDVFARRKDGSEFPVDASLSAFETDDGVFLTALIRDVTEQREIEMMLRRSERRFRAIFEEGPVGVLVIAADDTIVRANPALNRMLGYDKEALLGMRLRDITYGPDRGIGSRDRALMREGGLDTTQIRKRFLRKDGSVIWVDLSWSKLTEDGATLLVGLVQDVTTQREAEDALRKANDELRRASEAKSVFLARMSHELRTPLSAILISAEMLTTPAYGARSEEMLTQLGNRILQGGRHLLGLIDDLLDLTRIETGRLQITPVPVSAAGLMSELEGALGPHARRKQLRLELPAAEGITILADPLRLRQVFLNLIGNALKFTDAGGHVWVGITQRRGLVTISVADTGPGIAPEDLGRIFEPFEQASHRNEGAGLGLAISKQIVEMHGGTIKVDSRPGKGSIFLVTLAGVNADSTETDEPDASERSAARAGTILLVEDDEDIASLMLDVLRTAGYKPVHAATTSGAVEAAAASRPDLVLLDIGLGAESGLDIIDDLRSLPGGQATRILALSAYAMPDEIKRAKDAGCDDYLVKPLGAGDILARIAHWLAIGSGDNRAGSAGNGQEKADDDHAGAILGPDSSAH
ncbi:MAG TPA: PAS domain S-box protein [Actinomycetota bacterium]|nr:PAS domain S-box protein [Actinomycetota bacterium]